jgi:hypothetical protein
MGIFVLKKIMGEYETLGGVCASPFGVAMGFLPMME